MGMRNPSSSSTSKIPVGLSFSGVEGYKAFDVLSKAKDFGYSKSGLVVELLNIFDKSVNKYGEDMALFRLMECANRED